MYFYIRKGILTAIETIRILHIDDKCEEILKFPHTKRTEQKINLSFGGFPFNITKNFKTK